jgi:hypothetical protein
LEPERPWSVTAQHAFGIKGGNHDHHPCCVQSGDACARRRVACGHLYGRYQEETAALGFGGVSERLASQVGVAGPVNAFWAFVEAELGPALRYVQEAEAQPASPSVVQEAAAIEE